MRILMLGSKEYPFGSSAGHDPKAGGGIEFHVEKLSKYLARMGHEVYVITRQFPGQEKEETVDGVHVIRTRYVPNKYLRALSFNLLGFLKAMGMARRMDVIHTHAVIAGFFGAKLSMMFRRPMVLTPHGMIVGWGFPVKHVLRFMQKVALKGARRVLFISRPAKEALSRLSDRPGVLLSNAIDLEDYDFRTEKSGDVRFLFLGRLEVVKGVDTLIEAFSIMVKKYPKARLLIAGEGSMKARVVELVLKAGTEKVRYMGWMDSREALRKSDVFVLPSTEKGHPIALLEAMAAGKVIITSLPFIKPGKTGLACRAGDPKGLARVMLEVCRSSRKRTQLGRRARESVKPLTRESQAELFEKEYEKVL